MKRLVAAAGGRPRRCPIVAGRGHPGAGRRRPCRARRPPPPPRSRRDLLAVYMAASTTCPGLPWQVLAGDRLGRVTPRPRQRRPGDRRRRPADLRPAARRPPRLRAHPRPEPARRLRPRGRADAVPHDHVGTRGAAWPPTARRRPRPIRTTPGTRSTAAAAYLCAGEPALDRPRGGVLRYNRSDQYLADVLAKATEYGLGGPPLVDGGFAGHGDAVVAAAMTQLGVPYVWGAESPADGFDCSGLVQWSYAQIGVQLPAHDRRAGAPRRRRASTSSQLRPGDLLFTDSNRGGTIVAYGHVAIYAGGGMQIAAPRTGDVVEAPAGAVRPPASSTPAPRRLTQPGLDESE